MDEKNQLKSTVEEQERDQFKSRGMKSPAHQAWGDHKKDKGRLAPSGPPPMRPPVPPPLRPPPGAPKSKENSPEAMPTAPCKPDGPPPVRNVRPSYFGGAVRGMRPMGPPPARLPIRSAAQRQPVRPVRPGMWLNMTMRHFN